MWAAPRLLAVVVASGELHSGWLARAASAESLKYSNMPAFVRHGCKQQRNCTAANQNRHFNLTYFPDSPAAAHYGSFVIRFPHLD
jgi:hypothetical protein